MNIVYKKKGIRIASCDSISSFFQNIETELSKNKSDKYIYLFRGEYKNFEKTALLPSVYRFKNLKKEHILFREIKRFNGIDFAEDSTTLDHLSRMQHYSLPTRLVDLSEDPLSALWFAVSEAEKRREKGFRCVYMLKILKKDVRYYDSDTVTAIANLSKLPLTGDKKSKELINNEIRNIKDIKYTKNDDTRVVDINSSKALGYLHHEIKNDISHYEKIIQPEDLVSIQCVKPKLSSSRVHNQKGAFLIFGLNYTDVHEPIQIIGEYKYLPVLLKSTCCLNKNPIQSIFRIDIKKNVSTKLLGKIGVKMPYIYPEMEKVSEYFKSKNV